MRIVVAVFLRLLWQARLFDGSPIWLISKMQDVKDVLQDGRFSKVRKRNDYMPLSLLQLPGQTVSCPTCQIVSRLHG